METQTLLSPTAPMTNALLATLSAEEKALQRLASAADVQLAAMREEALERFETAGHTTADAVSELDQLGQARARQSRVFAKALGLDETVSIEVLVGLLPSREAEQLRTARDRVREAATVANARCDALAFALHYAVELGRATISAWRGLGPDRPAHVYTAAGLSETAPARMLLNRTG